MAELNDGDSIPVNFTSLKRYTAIQRLSKSASTVIRVSGQDYSPLFAGSESEMTSEGLVGSTGSFVKAQENYAPLNFSIRNPGTETRDFNLYIIAFFQEAPGLPSGPANDGPVNAGYMRVITPINIRFEDTVSVAIPGISVTNRTWDNNTVNFGGFNITIKYTKIPPPLGSGINVLQIVDGTPSSFADTHGGAGILTWNTSTFPANLVGVIPPTIPAPPSTVTSFSTIIESNRVFTNTVFVNTLYTQNVPFAHPHFPFLSQQRAHISVNAFTISSVYPPGSAQG